MFFLYFIIFALVYLQVCKWLYMIIEYWKWGPVKYIELNPTPYRPKHQKPIKQEQVSESKPLDPISYAFRNITWDDVFNEQIIRPLGKNPD